MKSVPRFGSIAGGCQPHRRCIPPAVRHVEGFPKHRTGFLIERDDTAAKTATGIRWVKCQSLLTRRDANVNNAVEDHRRSSNDCSWMILHVCHPPECS